MQTRQFGEEVVVVDYEYRRHPLLLSGRAKSRHLQLRFRA
jgi:hypothetical protein